MELRKELLQPFKCKQLAISSKLLLLKYIELNLYYNASSIEEYADISTLKKRMVQVVKKMACNARRHIQEKNGKNKDNMKKEDEQDHRNGASQEGGTRKQF